MRGEGLLLAVGLRDPGYVKFTISQAPEYGLILDYFLFCDDAFRIAPPLIISEDQIAFACDTISRLLDDAERNTGSK